MVVRRYEGQLLARSCDNTGSIASVQASQRDTDRNDRSTDPAIGLMTKNAVRKETLFD